MWIDAERSVELPRGHLLLSTLFDLPITSFALLSEGVLFSGCTPLSSRGKHPLHGPEKHLRSTPSKHTRSWGLWTRFRSIGISYSKEEYWQSLKSLLPTGGVSILHKAPTEASVVSLPVDRRALPNPVLLLPVHLPTTL